MSALLILPAIWLVWCIIAPTREGLKARHSIWCITRPRGPVNPDGSITKFAHGQEKGEWRLHKLLAKLAGDLFPAAIFALGLTVHPPALMVLVIGAQAVVMILVDNGTRKLSAIDYAGHGAEIMAAEAAGVPGYRGAEIARMSDDRDKQVPGVEDLDDVKRNIGAQLDRWRWLAWVVFWLGRERRKGKQ